MEMERWANSPYTNAITLNIISIRLRSITISKSLLHISLVLRRTSTLSFSLCT